MKKSILENNIKLWYSIFPKNIVQPYYAMKCNDNPYVLTTLYNNGFFFDCASRKEISHIMKKFQVKGNEIIYANPVKSQSDINYSLSRNVKLFTVDNKEELKKLNNNNYLLRIAIDDKYSLCKLNSKFGIQKDEIDDFMKHKGKGFKGFAFHVGSNCMNHNSYFDALDIIEKYLNHDDIIDIGGGFNKTINYNDLIKVSDRIKGYKNKIIAEPGRYLVEDIMDLYVTVIGKSNNKVTINSSLYGDLNCIAFDHKVCKFDIIRNNNIINDTKTEKVNIFGNTCDSIDIIFKDIECPKIQVNDVLRFHNMGAYTIVSRSNFNGIQTAMIKIIP